MNKNFLSIHKYLTELPIISSHEHHLETKQQMKLTLDSIFKNSYVDGVRCLLLQQKMLVRNGLHQYVQIHTLFGWKRVSARSMVMMKLMLTIGILYLKILINGIKTVCIIGISWNVMPITRNLFRTVIGIRGIVYQIRNLLHQLTVWILGWLDFTRTV